MPLLKHCCCCWQLKTGGLVLGCVQLILSLLIIAVCGVTLKYPHILTPDIAALVEQTVTYPHELTPVIDDAIYPASIHPDSVKQTDEHGIPIGLNEDMEPELKKEKHLQVTVIVAAVVGLVCGTLNLIASIFLIEGVAKSNPFLLMPILILKMTAIAINVVRDLSIISLGLFGTGFGALVIEGLNFYFWLVILSLYKELRKNHCPRDESNNTERAQALQVL